MELIIYLHNKSEINHCVEFSTQRIGNYLYPATLYHLAQIKQ